jgi:hypothetical protein
MSVSRRTDNVIVDMRERMPSMWTEDVSGSLWSVQGQIITRTTTIIIVKIKC